MGLSSKRWFSHQLGPQDGLLIFFTIWFDSLRYKLNYYIVSINFAYFYQRAFLFNQPNHPFPLFWSLFRQKTSFPAKSAKSFIFNESNIMRDPKLVSKTVEKTFYKKRALQKRMTVQGWKCAKPLYIILMFKRWVF